MSRKKLSNSKKSKSPEEKKRILDKRLSGWSSDAMPIKHAYLTFKVNQEAKQNSPETIAFYDRFYKKLIKHLSSFGEGEDTPVDWLIQEIAQPLFVKSLGNVSQQTINSYLRGYRAFGNFCEAQGFIEGFECPVKEVEPPLKQVYTDRELQKLLVKPSIENFEEFRNYTIITLILSNGARSHTILSIKIEDVDLAEGYIAYNTTKAHKVVRLGLDRKAKRALAEYIQRWRTVDADGEPIPTSDYLFCNTYGEQFTRSGFNKAIANYNRRRGVEKTGIHLLRHTFAKNWITSGGDIISLAKVLTHSELDMVKRYANLYGEDVKDKIEVHSTLTKLRTRSGKTIKTQ